jgi:hypothetical protein
MDMKAAKEQKSEDKENAAAVKAAQVSAFVLLSTASKLLDAAKAERLLDYLGCDTADGFIVLELKDKRALAACLKAAPKAQLVAAFGFSLAD